MEVLHNYDKYDVIIGAIADDKLFDTIDLYEDGYISAQNAIKVMNCMDYGIQIVLKSQRALDKITFLDYKLIDGIEKEQYRNSQKQDKQIAEKRTTQLLKQLR